MFKLEIKGMSCNHCVKAVTEAIAAVEGVESVEVNLDAGEALVRANNDSDATKHAAITAVQEEGYEASLGS